MNGYEFRTELAKLAPDYVIETDNEGQVVIYTGLKNDGTDNYVAITWDKCESCEADLRDGSWGGYCHDCENQVVA